MHLGLEKEVRVFERCSILEDPIEFVCSENFVFFSSTILVLSRARRNLQLLERNEHSHCGGMLHTTSIHYQLFTVHAVRGRKHPVCCLGSSQMKSTYDLVCETIANRTSIQFQLHDISL